MSTNEQESARRLLLAIQLLPPNKRERLYGYGEGILDMAERKADLALKASSAHTPTVADRQ